MLSGPRQKFCDGIVRGKTASDAYREAYPKSSPENARKNAPHLIARPEIRAEIARQRSEAEKMPGSGLMTVVEKRQWCARLLRADLEKDVPGDLWAGIDVEPGAMEGTFV